MLTQDNRKLNEIGIVNNDMINMGVSKLNSDEQDSMNAFFAALPNTQSRPRLTQQQLLNQMTHNAQNMRIKMEVEKIKQMFKDDRDFRTRLERGDTELFSALESSNNAQVEKLVTERLKEVMAKQKEEQER